MKAVTALTASLPLALAGPTGPLPAGLASLVARDPADPPKGLDECATENDKKYQPVMDFDKDGCYNTAAIDKDGNLNPGQDHDYTEGQAHCRDESDLDTQNVYSRARCNNDWCAYMYGYYFEKDVAVEKVVDVGGHRHDWEHTVVFVKDGDIKYVAVSAHGGYDNRDISDVPMDGTHPKIVYHKDGPSTHALRFAHDNDDDIENHKGEWFQGPLLSHYGWPDGDLRNKMYNNDWGDANIALKDDNFSDRLEKAIDGRDEIELDTEKDNGDSPGQPECSQ